jgi:S-DNA-T family DNA segregation ATPase FtsK/SpoIIIE
MQTERCDACGFDGDAWSDQAAVDEVARLGDRWVGAVADLAREDLRRRPIAHMWSIAEYADHVREVLFSLRFVLDSAVKDPGVDLGEAPTPEFTADPKMVDMYAALSGIEREATLLATRLRALPPDSWEATAFLDGDPVDAHWLCRHAVHDATHHLGDVTRLRASL